VRSIRSCLVALLGMAALVPPTFAQSGGFNACYKVNDPAPQRTFTVTVTNAGVTQTCKVRSPARLGCLATQVTGIVPAPPGASSPAAIGDVLCYRMRCPRPFPGGEQRNDELGGTRIVNLRRALMFCVPNATGSSTTTTTTPGPGVSTTTTTTVAPRECEFEDGRCVGTCGNGGRCSAVASGGACECRRTACGAADAPSCAGFCEGDQACIFDLTGCRCVSIP
jgi:hypothetical protein